MARVNIDILGLSELKQTGIGEFNAVLGCNLRNDRMISISFQDKPHSITVIQVYAPTSNAKKLKLNSVWWPTRPSRTNTKRCPFHHRGLECKSRKSRDTWSNRQVWPWSKKWSRTRLTEFCQRNALVRANTLFQQHKRWLYTWTSPDSQYWNQIDYIFFQVKMEKLYTVRKTRQEGDCGSDHEFLTAKFRLKLKKVGKTIRPFKYD